ncbi:hypothetical protein PILCRDRAFT_818924 [Piloderma croceum F 1598]|uniref:Uncharacterized protein n=1 Tax=Piloderma croceum (strain F 1598) TaxID=765440 RepID=A0A0C3C2U6_PILCF|nr:hypothetical protein PILCRDRAFT_818924 [Piloderma croceum F 1598]
MSTFPDLMPTKVVHVILYSTSSGRGEESRSRCYNLSAGSKACQGGLKGMRSG